MTTSPPRTTPARLGLRTVALGYLLVLVAVPIGLILWRTFEPGLGAFVESVRTPAALAAYNLSLLIVAIVVPLNVVFGIGTALATRISENTDVYAFLVNELAMTPVVAPAPGRRR